MVMPNMPRRVPRVRIKTGNLKCKIGPYTGESVVGVNTSRGNCVANYLNLYSHVAETGKNKEDLFAATESLVMFALEAEVQRLIYFNGFIREGKIDLFQHDNWAYQHIKDPDVNNLAEIAKVGGIITDIKSSEMEKMLAVDRFAHLQHRSGKILPLACNMMMGEPDVFGEEDEEHIAEQADKLLNCVANEPENPYRVMERLKQTDLADPSAWRRQADERARQQALGQVISQRLEER